eukprot:scaffold126570_cov27-Tisochrysis_lutea.AAC.1
MFANGWDGPGARRRCWDALRGNSECFDRRGCGRRPSDPASPIRSVGGHGEGMRVDARAGGCSTTQLEEGDLRVMEMIKARERRNQAGA